MALVLADRVQETTTTTGTGTVTLAGAVAGYRSFATIGNGNTTYYTIAGGSEWEVGIGTYTSSGTTLSRDTVLSSSAGGTTKVTFSAGTKDVFVTYPSGKSVNLDGTGVLAVSANEVITSTNANSLAVGRQGVTNPVLNVDASTASVVTGLNLKGAAAAGGMALSVTSSGANENLTIDAKGSGTITLASSSFGAIAMGRALGITSTSTQGLAVGRQGTSNPVLNVDSNTTNVVTGLNLKGAAAAGGMAVSVISSGTNESLTIDAKGTGAITLNATGTGSVLVNRLLDISASTAGQIKFPATANASADANTLDDYEEGTWTMGVSFGGAAVGITYTGRDASYVKIGRTVSIVGGLTLSNKGSSTGVARVTGLPFTTNTGTYQQYSSNNIAGVPGATVTGVLALGTYFTGSATTLDVIQISTTGSLSTVADTAFSNTTSVYGSLTFVSTT